DVSVPGSLNEPLVERRAACARREGGESGRDGDGKGRERETLLEHGTSPCSRCCAGPETDSTSCAPQIAAMPSAKQAKRRRNSGDERRPRRASGIARCQEWIRG